MPIMDTKKLKQTLVRIERERDRLHELSDHFRHVIEYLEEESDSEALPLTPGKEMDNAMERIFESDHTYMHPKIMLDKLTEIGIKVPGENPTNNTRSHLSLDDRFEPVGNGLWGLSKWEGADLRTKDAQLVQGTQPAPHSNNGRANPTAYYITDITGQAVAVELEALPVEEE